MHCLLLTLPKTAGFVYNLVRNELIYSAVYIFVFHTYFQKFNSPYKFCIQFWSPCRFDLVTCDLTVLFVFSSLVSTLIRGYTITPLHHVIVMRSNKLHDETGWWIDLWWLGRCSYQLRAILPSLLPPPPPFTTARRLW